LVHPLRAEMHLSRRTRFAACFCYTGRSTPFNAALLVRALVLVKIS
jgi:hypothetical protein